MLNKLKQDQNFRAGALELLPLLEPDELDGFDELLLLLLLLLLFVPELPEELLPDPEKTSRRKLPALLPLPR